MINFMFRYFSTFKEKTCMCHVPRTWSYSEEEGISQDQKQSSCVFPYHSPLLKLTSHAVYQASPHLPASTSHKTLAQEYLKRANHIAPPHTHDSPSGASELSRVPSPQPRIMAPCSLPTVSPLFQNCSTLPSSGKQSARFVEHSQIQWVEEEGWTHI